MRSRPSVCSPLKLTVAWIALLSILTLHICWSCALESWFGRMSQGGEQGGEKVVVFASVFIYKVNVGFDIYPGAFCGFIVRQFMVLS